MRADLTAALAALDALIEANSAGRTPQSVVEADDLKFFDGVYLGMLAARNAVQALGVTR